MGVKDLWQLLAPIGRRVSIETLEGKILAIDASVWIVQFIKAIRDETGTMQKNAHVIGTIRRILKLLFHKIKPIFVFDGATPTLKIKTVQARRERKSGNDRDQRLVAQRILMSQIKQNLIKTKLDKNALKSAISLESSTTAIAADNGLYAASFKPLKRQSNDQSKSDNQVVSSIHHSESRSENTHNSNEMIIDMRKPMIMSSSSSSSAVAVVTKQEEDDVDWEDGYESLTGKANKINQKKLSTDDNTDIDNNEDDDSDDEINLDLPEDGADIDVKALAALPSYLRKDVIEAARRKERMKSRSTYIPIADDPAMYSQTQIANFLKTSHLNKKIAKAQKMVDEEEDGGKRIAADGSRKYLLFFKTNDREASAALEQVTTERYPKRAEFDWLDDINSDDEKRDNDNDDNSDDGSIEYENNSQADQPHSPTSYKKSQSRLIEKKTTSQVSFQSSSNGHNSDDNDNNDDGDDSDDGGGFLKSDAVIKKIIKPTRLTKRVTFQDSADVSPSDLGVMDDLREQLIVSNDNDDDISTNYDNPVISTAPVTDIISRKRSSDNNRQSSLKTAVESVDTDASDVEWESDGETDKPTESINLNNNSTLLASVSNQSSTVVSKFADDYIYDDDDEWEQNLVMSINRTNENQIVSSSSLHIDKYNNTDADDSFMHSIQSPVLKEEGFQSKQSLSEDVARRAVNMASGMADWAGRAVQRALKDHMTASSSSSSSSSQLMSGFKSSELTSPPAIGKVDIIDRELLMPYKSETLEPTLVTTKSIAIDESVEAYQKEDTNSPMKEPVDLLDPILTSPTYNSSDTQTASQQQVQMIQNVSEMSKTELEIALRDEEMFESMARRSRAMNMRDAEGMTDEMRDDVIALLNVFEIPYMIAPYEAEAQCAVLEQLGLVDGVVTEDSDSFLFGAKTVYRNIFNDKKYVEAYLSSDASTELGIDREDFVALSFFLGSDYTEGVSGIGVVNSLEILQAFPVKCENRINNRIDMSSIKSSNNTQNDSETGDENFLKVQAVEYAAGVERGLCEFKLWVQSFEPAEYVNSLLQKRRSRQGEVKEKISVDKDEDNNEAADSQAEVGDDEEEEKPSKKRKIKSQNVTIKPKKKSKLTKTSKLFKEMPIKLTNDNADDIFGLNIRSEELISDDNNQSELSCIDSIEATNTKLIAFTDKHRSGRMSWKLPGIFPDQRVVDAYLNPAANRDHTPFSWPIPKLHRVRKYCAEMLGWIEGQMDAQVDPVVRKLMEKTTQPRIDSHFMTYQQNSRFAKVASVRLTTAISQITGKNLVPTVTRSPPAKQTKARKRKKTDGTDGDAPANQESNSQ